MIAPHRVPFLDLAEVNARFAADFTEAWSAILAHGWYIGGPEVEEFEARFAAYCEVSGCVAVANGTDALELILRALGIGRGDEVIVPANTFVATAEAVCAVGARPRFVDVRPDTLLMCEASVRSAINASTAAIILVHLFGQMVDHGVISQLAQRHGIALVEDAAQAHGARFLGRRAGSVGIAGAFSFYPAKNLGALSDAGAVVSSDAELLAQVRALANHGRSPGSHHDHVVIGRNSRMDSLQAALLSRKLICLDADNARRADTMAQYRRQLPAACVPVATDPRAEAVYHLAVVQVPHRAAITTTLTRRQIGWGIHYPKPCHQQPAFSEFCEHLPVCGAAAERLLSLPLSPTMRQEAVLAVCDALVEAIDHLNHGDDA
jgi:dTDP-4-amino-4,6-dideoxygalactose transaminase